MAKDTPKTASVTMTQEKVCKGSIKYGTKDPKAPVDNVYLSKEFSDPMPSAITVTVTPAS